MKDQYLQIRVSKEQKEIISMEAKRHNMSMAGYIWFLVLKKKLGVSK